MKRTYPVVPALLVLLVTLMVSAQNGAGGAAEREREESNIREAVFRYRIDKWEGRGPFFLSIDGTDPSDAFMSRFSASKKIVKKASQSYFKMDAWMASGQIHGGKRDFVFS